MSLFSKQIVFFFLFGDKNLWTFHKHPMENSGFRPLTSPEVLVSTSLEDEIPTQGGERWSSVGSSSVLDCSFWVAIAAFNRFQSEMPCEQWTLQSVESSGGDLFVRMVAFDLVHLDMYVSKMVSKVERIFHEEIGLMICTSLCKHFHLKAIWSLQNGSHKSSTCFRQGSTFENLAIAAAKHGVTQLNVKIFSVVVDKSDAGCLQMVQDKSSKDQPLDVWKVVGRWSPLVCDLRTWLRPWCGWNGPKIWAAWGRPQKSQLDLDPEIQPICRWFLKNW